MNYVKVYEHKDIIKLGLTCLMVLLLNNKVFTQQKDTLLNYNMDEIVVSDTREYVNRNKIAATVDLVKSSEIKDIKPAHPSVIMGLVPGVWVGVTGGEGHMTAIRQPLTTSPVYLYLEDGIPTRSTGFFNHNALYEIDIPMARGIEVTKGPGSALYGSDAIGGIVNVLTKSASFTNQLDASLETGSYGWLRGLFGTSLNINGERIRIDLNGTKTNGWRDNTDYKRYSSTVRYDHIFDNFTTLKAVVDYAYINQNTAGSSRISEADYLNNPTINYTPISYRKVRALRASLDYEKESGASLISIIPYFRYNSMNILPNWSLSYDPTIYNDKNNSFGLMTKYRLRINPFQTEIIAGLDLEISPGSHFEESIKPSKTGSVYTSYTIVQPIYNYDVTFYELSPYMQIELAPLKELTINLGVRYDNNGFTYKNYLGELESGKWKRPGNTNTRYNHLSPKAGITYSFSKYTNVYFSYRHGFRVPSQSQLFRQGSAINTVDLIPVKVNSYDVGIRGNIKNIMNYEVSLYIMKKTDDILRFKNPNTGLTESVNAGQTLHKGIEAGIGLNLFYNLKFNIAYSYAKHMYEDWIVSSVVDYSGNEMETAPREIGNFRLSYEHTNIFAALELVTLSSYWMDAANTFKYNGHKILNFRFNVPVYSNIKLFGSITNLANVKYAENASYSTFRGKEYAPGMPRSFTIGVDYNL